MGDPTNHLDIDRTGVHVDSNGQPGQPLNLLNPLNPLNPFNRRRFLSVGGTTLLVAAVTAACGKTSTSSTVEGTTSTTTTVTPDITALHTALSIEYVLINAYQTMLDSNVIKRTDINDAFRLFQTHHKDHATLLQAKTTDAGGETYTKPNSLILATVATPRLAHVRSESDLLQLAYDLEHLAAETYQADVGGFQNPLYNQTAMSMGGVEARHVAVLGHLLGKPDLPTDGSFQKSAGAVPSGSGISS